MRILDRYILREFIRGFFLSLFALIFIHIVVEMFEQISMFIDRNVGMLKVLEYYLYELPSAVTFLSPIAILIACFISVGSLSKHFELVAIRGAGISPLRIVLPLSIAGCVITLSMFILGETLIPISLSAKEQFKREEIRGLPPKRVGIARDVYFVGEENRFYKIDYVDGSTSTVKGITIYKFSDDMRLVERIDARSGRYGQFFWVFYDGVLRRWNGRDDKISIYEQVFDTLRVDWLKEGIEMLLVERKKPETMNYRELQRYIEFRRRSGYDVTEELSDLYYKISYHFINLIIILIGVPLATKVRTSGLVFGFAIAMLSSFLYWGITQLGRALGRAGFFSPALGSWLPNIIFAIVGGLLLYDMLRR